MFDCNEQVSRENKLKTISFLAKTIAKRTEDIGNNMSSH